MTEHNLPDKDDAPWLDCMDGLRTVSNHTNPGRPTAASTSMPELSPASLEVWSRYCSIVEEYGSPRLALAAALRAAADQVVPEDYRVSIAINSDGDGGWVNGLESRNKEIRDELLAIAAELKAHD